MKSETVLLRDESISEKMTYKCKHCYHKCQGTAACTGRAGLLGADDALVLDLGGGYADVCFIILLNYPNTFYAVLRSMYGRIHNKKV